MRTFILAALLLATIPVSEVLVKAFPPPKSAGEFRPAKKVQPKPVSTPESYALADIAAQNALVDSTRTKIVSLWKRDAKVELRLRQAAVYARVYSIDTRHLDNAMKIFGR